MNEQEQLPVQPRNRPNWGVGIALGAGVGVAFGVAMDNMWLGLALGIAFGVSFAVATGSGAQGHHDADG